MENNENKIIFNYSVPDKWYEGLYKDKQPCRSAARPFCLVHEQPAGECWLLIHGYRGYPGELVRPAVDLYGSGFDVYVPRLPGHGTCGADFARSCADDWTGVIRNAINDITDKYGRVNLLGHSMGTAIAAVLGSGNPAVGKIIYVSPSFENLQMTPASRVILKLLSPFTPKIRCKWHPSSKYHLHYENAPCDEMYLGTEYFRWFFTKKLGEYYRLMKKGLECVSAYPHEHLVICPLLDKIISVPSVQLYKKAVGERENIIYIENATHSVFYDKDPAAEEAAVAAVIGFAVEKQLFWRGEEHENKSKNI
ncbi:MAG: alpha/beta fold hydrolase [Parasporobacterium sp.]|nr:alpha/beta fold hydrolase [Parasporobacterium sp.]